MAGAPALHSSQETADYIRPQIGNADRETFVILHLDVKNQLLDVELHGLGDVDSSAVYPRQVFRSALLRNAAALIFVHNHPSGDPEPSLCDRELTRGLVLGARALGVKVLDHIILGRNRYFSMADQGLIDDYALMASGPCVREDPAPYARPLTVREAWDILKDEGKPGHNPTFEQREEAWAVINRFGIYGDTLKEMENGERYEREHNEAERAKGGRP